MCVTHYDTFRAVPCKDVVGQRVSLWTPIYVGRIDIDKISAQHKKNCQYRLGEVCINSSFLRIYIVPTMALYKYDTKKEKCSYEV